MVEFLNAQATNVTSVSMVATCDTDSTTTVFVDWGLAPDALTNSVGPTASGTSHKVPLRRLPVGKAIYWRFRSGSDVSSTSTISTPPVGVGYGLNVPHAYDYLTARVFKNQMLQSRPLLRNDYSPYGFTGDQDSNGWLQSLEVGEVWRTLLCRDIDGRYPSGTWKVTWEGTGTVEVGLNAVESSRTANSILFTVPTRDDGGIEIRCTATNAAPNHVRNVKVWAPGDHDATDTFADEFLNLLREGSTYWPGILRMLHWTHANKHAHRLVSSISTGGSTTITLAQGHGWTTATRDIQFWGVSELDGLHTASVVDPTTLTIPVSTSGSLAGGIILPQVVDWADRIPTTYQSQGTTRGVALEFQIELCNLVGADLWLPIPANASDDWVRGAADLIDSTLNKDLALVVEQGNENWNGAFPQKAFSSAKGAAMSFQGDEHEQANRYHGYRTEQLAALARARFTDPGRVTVALGSQLANTGVTTQALAQVTNKANLDVLAVNPYAGGYLGESANGPTVAGWTQAQVLDEVERNIPDTSDGGPFTQPGLRKLMDAHFTVANGESLDVWAYEGGQHVVQAYGPENATLTTLFTGANRDARMYEIHALIAEQFRAAGGKKFCWFETVGKYTKDGSWGGKEFGDEAIDTGVLKLLAWRDIALSFASAVGKTVGAGVLDALLNATPYAVPTTTYLGLLAVMPRNAKGDGYTEPSYISYKRLAVSSGMFAAADAANAIAALIDIPWPLVPDSTSLAAAVSEGVASSGAPPRIVGIAFFDDPTPGSGTYLAGFQLPTAVDVSENSFPRIPAGTTAVLAFP